MLETIREYAAKRLDESGEADVLLERLGKHLIALAVAEGAPGFMERQAEAYDRLEPEHANTRTVMGWALAKGRYEIAAELTVLALAWIARGHLSEARGWFDAVLEARRPFPRERGAGFSSRRSTWPRPRATMHERSSWQRRSSNRWVTNPPSIR